MAGEAVDADNFFLSAAADCCDVGCVITEFMSVVGVCV